MIDEAVRALGPGNELNISVVVVTRAAREARRLHLLRATSASLLGRALAGAALLATLQKGKATHLNLQLECDGPLRGLLVDASTDGSLRGYVKNPLLDVEGFEGPSRFRPAFGNQGFLSVLRDTGDGEFYRSSVELMAMDLSLDLGHYFETSDQVATRLAISVEAVRGEPLGGVAGVLVQALPDTDPGRLDAFAANLQERLDLVLRAEPSATAAQVMRGLFGDGQYEVTSTTELAWRCPCSKDRVLNALVVMGVEELTDILEKDGQASATCQFCGRRHIADADDLRALIAHVTATEAKN